MGGIRLMREGGKPTFHLLTMRFGMEPKQWAVLDLNRTGIAVPLDFLE